MVKNKKFRSLEDAILLLQQELKQAQLSIKDILRVLSGKGRFLVLVLLSVPFCQPIQIPGLSTPFGLVIAFIGLRIAFGKRIWLPKTFLSKKVSASTIKKIANKVLILVRKIKYLIYPRLVAVCHSCLMEKVHGFVIVILGFFLALPLPIPFSNLIAAWSVCLISLGMLEDDGFFVLIGYMVFLLIILFFVFILLTMKNIYGSL